MSRLIDNVCRVQQETGITFVIPNWEFLVDDVKAVGKLMSILETGRAVYDSPDYRLVLDGPKDEDESRKSLAELIEACRSGDAYRLAFDANDIQFVKLFESNIPLGKAKMEVSGVVDPTTIAEIESLISRGIVPESVQIRFCPAHVVAEYSEWVR